MKNHWQLIVWAMLLVIPISCAVCEKQMPIEEYKKPVYNPNTQYAELDNEYHIKR